MSDLEQIALLKPELEKLRPLIPVPIRFSYDFEAWDGRMSRSQHWLLWLRLGMTLGEKRLHVDDTTPVELFAHAVPSPSAILKAKLWGMLMVLTESIQKELLTAAEPLR